MFIDRLEKGLHALPGARSSCPSSVRAHEQTAPALARAGYSFGCKHGLEEEEKEGEQRQPEPSGSCTNTRTEPSRVARMRSGWVLLSVALSGFFFCGCTVSQGGGSTQDVWFTELLKASDLLCRRARVCVKARARADGSSHQSEAAEILFLQVPLLHINCLPVKMQ